MKSGKAEAGGVAAVERAFTILDAFRGSKGVLTLVELADRTGFYKSTILRIVVSLEAFGCIRRLPSGEFRLGPKLAELAAVYQSSFDFSEFVVPVLKALVETTLESASYYVRDDDRRVCLFRVDAPQHIRDHVRVGDSLPLSVGAAGRVLLRYGSGLADGTPVTRKDFVIVTRGERQADTAAVAAPVFSTGGRLAGALSISGPRVRFTNDHVGRISAALEREAVRLSEFLGADRRLFSTLRGARAA